VSKVFQLQADEIKDIVTDKGWCIASDRITVDGCHVGFMYRETPYDAGDSGWRFFAGDESDSYVNDPANLAMYDLNTIANYDPAIIPLLDSSTMSAFERSADSREFTAVRFPEAGLN
jgi:hypothetical protein